MDLDLSVFSVAVASGFEPTDLVVGLDVHEERGEHGDRLLPGHRPALRLREQSSQIVTQMLSLDWMLVQYGGIQCHKNFSQPFRIISELKVSSPTPYPLLFTKPNFFFSLP